MPEACVKVWMNKRNNASFQAVIGLLSLWLACSPGCAGSGSPSDAGDASELDPQWNTNGACAREENLACCGPSILDNCAEECFWQDRKCGQLYVNDDECDEYGFCLCGDCPAGQVCGLNCEDSEYCFSSECVPAQEACGNASDGYEICRLPDVCNAGVCACLPDCVGRDCGDDACGGICGTCPQGEECDVQGLCVCQPACEDKECGPDGCGGVCGVCAANALCSIDAKCVCIPDCKGKDCGSDGCDGSCGECPEGQQCNEQGSCEP